MNPPAAWQAGWQHQPAGVGLGLDRIHLAAADLLTASGPRRLASGLRRAGREMRQAVPLLRHDIRSAGAVA